MGVVDQLNFFRCSVQVYGSGPVWTEEQKSQLLKIYRTAEVALNQLNLERLTPGELVNVRKYVIIRDEVALSILLPKDSLQEVFGTGLLSDQELLAQLSGESRQIATEISSRRILKKIEAFIEFAVGEVPVDQRESLQKIKDSIPMLNSKNSVELQQLTHDLLDQVVSALRVLPSPSLFTVRSARIFKNNPPSNLKTLCELVCVLVNADWIFKAGVPNHDSLKEIVSDLVQMGFISKALSLSNQTDSQRFQSIMLDGIVHALLDKCYFERALAVAYSIPETHTKSVALASIFENQVERGEFKQVLSALRLIPQVMVKVNTIIYLSELLAEKLDIEKALMVANLLSESVNENTAIVEGRGRVDAITGISKTLTKNGYLKHALSVAELLSQDFGKGLALLGISKTLAEKEDFDNALTVAQSISDKELFSKALFLIFQVVRDNGRWDQALTTANLIPDDDEKSNALYYICCHYWQCRNVSEARKIAALIPSEKKRETAKKDINFFLEHR